MKNLLLFLACSFGLAAVSQNPACPDDGFENLSTGTLSSTVWTALSYNFSSGSSGCQTAPVASSYAPTQLVSIVTTPVTDPMVNDVPASPFDGNQVAYLNGGYTSKVRLSKTINVTPSNFVYRYAYKARLGGIGCGAAMLVFSFYDCSNTLISSISKTIQPTSAFPNFPLPFPTDAEFFTPVTTPLHTQITPEWVIHAENLAPYIGSCVKVNVDLLPCICGGYPASCYFDDMCANGFVNVDATGDVSTQPSQHLIGTNTYTSCANSAIVSGLAGFSSYSWQGPAGVSIANPNQSSILAPVSGVYTLTASSGTNSFTQHVNLTLNPTILSISGATAVCEGNSVQLQANGTGISSYLWSTGSSAAFITVTPTAAISNYYVTVNNALGCADTKTTTVLRIANPGVVISAPSLTVCQGNAVNLSIVQPQYAYVWSNAASGPSVSVIPASQGTALYTATATNVYGCTGTASIELTVHALPQVSISGASAVCDGQPVTLSAQGSGIAGYQWSNGSTLPSIQDAPSQNTTYLVTVISSEGCTSSGSHFITVNPVSQIELTASSNHICEGEAVQMNTQSGNSLSYSWNTGASGASLSDLPAQTSTYVVTATDGNGCSSVASIVILVDKCTGIATSAAPSQDLFAFPNPCNGFFTIQARKDTHGTILNSLGQVITEFTVNTSNSFSMEVSDLPAGIYYVKAGSGVTKVIIH